MTLLLPHTARYVLIPAPAALALDRALGEPPASLHPVVWLGKVIAALDEWAPAHAAPRVQLAYGAVLAGATLTVAAVPAWALQRACRRLPVLVQAVVLALALKPAFAWRALEEHVQRVGDALQAEDVPAARTALSMIVSRQTAGLDAPRLAAGAIESLAENLSDSVVAPLLWYAAGGLPAAWAYRAANTMDAMIGYRTERYEHLGKPAARLDDALNWLPARLTALALAALAGLAGGDSRRAWRTLGRDGGATASPNAGRPMAAMAGALGVELEKVGHYRLGRGLAHPTGTDVKRAIRLSRLAAVASLGLVWLVRWAAATAAARRRRPAALRGRR